MKKRRQPQQSRSQASVDAILDAVSRVLREQGRASLTTNHIAETAGVSVGTLYQYFSNKQDIYTALHEREYRRTGDSVKKAFADTEGGSLDDLITTLMDAVIAERLRDPDTHRLLMTTVPRRSDRMDASNPLALAFYAAVASHQDELRKDCDLDRFVFILSHMITSFANAVVLLRPAAITFDHARADAISAIRAYIRTEAV